MADDQETRPGTETSEPLGYRTPEKRKSRNIPILVAKIAVMAVVLGWVGWTVYKAWRQVNGANIAIDWRWSPVAIACFCGNILTSAAVWVILGRRMGDRSPGVGLMGAYTFSQLGKYVPGKVFLLLLRIERAGRVGMNARTCTLSTILENALYMVSGGIVGMTAIAHLVGGLVGKAAAFQPVIWPATVVIVIGLFAACYPPVFYLLVNRVLRGMKKPVVPNEERLALGTFVLAILGFVPCWIFGGLALWGATRAVHDMPLVDAWWFAGAFALSVIIGMASFLPGGAGIRDAVVGAVVVIALKAQGIPQDNAVLMGGIVAILLRVFQLAAELLLGAIGAIVTAKRSTPEPRATPR